MVSIRCMCGQISSAAENGLPRELACACGRKIHIACAEQLPEGAGEGDFDAQLHIKGPGDARMLVALGGCAEITLGRLPDNTLVLPGNKVSRHHARLIRADFGPSRWKIADAGSSGGTFVNGRKLEGEHLLEPGDRVVLGAYQMKYVLTGAPVETAAEPAALAPLPTVATPPPLPQTAGLRPPAPRRGQKSGGGRSVVRVLAIVAGVVVVGLVGLAVLLYPALRAARERAASLACATSLKVIDTLSAMYERDYGALPPTLGHLMYLNEGNWRVFLCVHNNSRPPDDVLSDRGLLAAWVDAHTDFAYVGPLQSGGVLAYEKLPHASGQVNVLMADGGIERLTPEELRGLLAVRPHNTPAGAGSGGGGRAGAGADPLDWLPGGTRTLAQVRKQFPTQLNRQYSAKTPVDKPPAGIFDLVQYDAPPGKLAAYVTPDPGDGTRRPAIIWITGGDCNTIGDVWTAQPASNDQTASAYRQAGIVMMFPSLRGGNENPGYQEGFFGEVDDVLAAADYLAAQPYVDPQRIYLGGHSTGGTLVLLVAECSDRFRAVFSFGPLAVPDYDPDTIVIPVSRNLLGREMVLRSPGGWLYCIKSPTFILEGERQPSNAVALTAMDTPRASPAIRFLKSANHNHFSILAPANALIASRILADTGPECNINITAADVASLTVPRPPATPRPPTTPTPPDVGPPTTPAQPSPAQDPILWSKLLLPQAGEVLRNVTATGGAFTAIAYSVTPDGRITALSALPGGQRGNLTVLEAREGYVVYGLIVNETTSLHALKVVFVRRDGDRVVPQDTYTSDWIGAPQGDAQRTIGCNGRMIIALRVAERGRTPVAVEVGWNPRSRPPGQP